MALARRRHLVQRRRWSLRCTCSRYSAADPRDSHPWTPPALLGRHERRQDRAAARGWAVAGSSSAATRRGRCVDRRTAEEPARLGTISISHPSSSRACCRPPFSRSLGTCPLPPRDACVPLAAAPHCGVPPSGGLCSLIHASRSPWLPALVERSVPRREAGLVPFAQEDDRPIETMRGSGGAGARCRGRRALCYSLLPLRGSRARVRLLLGSARVDCIDVRDERSVLILCLPA